MFLANQCQGFIKTYLRAPPKLLLRKWGKKLKLNPDEIQEVDSQLTIRHQLGKRDRRKSCQNVFKNVVLF